jgi:hypothetical protein
MAETEYSERSILAECHQMLGQLLEEVRQLAARVDQLESEFAPLARKYTRVVDAAAKLPGVGLRGRGASNGNLGAPGAATWRSRPWS